MTSPTDPAPSRFDLNLVRALTAIYETRSVTLAAERLGLTQPSISHALARLRERYGDRLFNRGAQGLAPTAVCERLYEQFALAQSTIERTLEADPGFVPSETTRRFRIATSDIGALFFIPPLLRRFQAAAPRLQAEFVPFGEAVADDLATGAIDMAIGNLPHLHGHTREALLFVERYVGLVSARHPSIGAALDLADFVQARHVMVSSPSSGHSLIDAVLAQQGVRRNVVALVPHFSVLPSVVEESDLIVVLPERVAKLFVAQRKVRSVELPVAIAPFQVRLHWHARSENSAAHRWLRDEVTGTLSRL